MEEQKRYKLTKGLASQDSEIMETTSVLSWKDRWGGFKVRWGIKRMKYKVTPGLYKLGTPDASAPVLVTANYKLSFDSLRKELKGLSLWILVLDTKGINVWCAAGKGTFGTEELIRRINKVNLSSVVKHNTIILPQLGAPGVAGFEVTKKTGFKVVYGPVRASDIPRFLIEGMTADHEMRQVRFTMYDRLVLTPMELVTALKTLIFVFGIFFVMNHIGLGLFGRADFYGLLGAVVIGCVLTPVLLPFIPGRAFSWKGWVIGLIGAMGLNLFFGWPYSQSFGFVQGVSYLFIMPSISGFLAMNFTGSSTYTSFSGVIKEMKFAVPAFIIMAFIGALLRMLALFIH